MKNTGAKRVMVLLLSLFWLSVSGCSTYNDSPQPSSQFSPVSQPNIGVQLWSVKNELREDFKGTLKTLASMGFDGVEFFGHEFGEFADDPAGLKQFLEQHNLKASSAHVHFKHLKPEVFDATVAFYKTIECDKLLIAMDKRAWDPQGVHEVVKELNQLATKLAPHGISIGYHNHAQEFRDFQDATYWDFIARSTPENVILQLDVGWANYAGKDPIAYVQRYPERTVVTHYKIRTHEGTQDITPIIGQDGFNWAALLSANIEVGGTRWVIIEQEEYPNGLTPLEAVAASKKGLDSYLAKYRTP